MRGEQDCLRPLAPFGPASDGPDARGMQAQCLAQQHREEQVRLAAVHEPGQPPGSSGLPGGKGQRLHSDVGIGALGIGIRVMAVVLAHPVPEAEADAEVAQQEAEPTAERLGCADLPMARVVAEEAHLGEHDRQEHGHRDLPPGIADQEEGGPPSGQQRQGRHDPDGIPPGFALHQARLLHQPGQLGVITAARRRGGRTGRRGCRGSAAHQASASTLTAASTEA